LKQVAAAAADIRLVAFQSPSPELRAPLKTPSKSSVAVRT
jgi:hypothetical protein